MAPTANQETFVQFRLDLLQRDSSYLANGKVFLDWVNMMEVHSGLTVRIPATLALASFVRNRFSFDLPSSLRSLLVRTRLAVDGGELNTPSVVKLLYRLDLFAARATPGIGWIKPGVWQVQLLRIMLSKRRASKAVLAATYTLKLSHNPNSVFESSTALNAGRHGLVLLLDLF
jgi:hypothetical protein